MVLAATVLVGVTGPASAGGLEEAVSHPIQNEVEKLASKVRGVFGHAGGDIPPDPPIVVDTTSKSRLLPAPVPTKPLLGESGSISALFDDVRAQQFVDYVAQQLGEPPGVVTDWIDLVRDLSESGEKFDSNSLSPGQRKLLSLGSEQYGKHCGSYVTLDSMINIQPIDDAKSETQQLCTMLGNAAVIARKFAALMGTGNLLASPSSRDDGSSVLAS